MSPNPAAPPPTLRSSVDGASQATKQQDELVQRAVAGELDAITELLRQLGPGVARTARVILGSQHPDVDDVVQQALVALVRGLQDYRGEAKLATYAGRIAARAALAARRRVKRQVEVYESYAQERAATEDASVADAASLGLSGSLRALLDELVEEQAETLTLRTVLGYSIDEIAESMQVPRNTVKSRLRLAKAALRRLIERDALPAESGPPVESGRSVESGPPVGSGAPGPGDES